MRLFTTRKLVILLILFLLIFTDPITGAASLVPENDPGKGALDAGIREAAVLINASSYKEAEDILLDYLLDILEKDLPDRGGVYFLLGRLNRLRGDHEKAEGYLIKAADDYPLLRDYALSMLIDIYVDSGQLDKALGTSRKITNGLLLREAGRNEISALLALERDDEALEALLRYTKKYGWDWDYKMNLAIMLKERGESGRASALLKDIYIKAVPQSDWALEELKSLKADIFTSEETLKRADNLYKRFGYRKAEAAYKNVLADAPEEQSRIIYKIAMCQFRQKKYAASAKTFGRLGGPRSMYWRARSFYRINDTEGFQRAKQRFEETYPGSKDLALVFLMEAEEFRRQSRFDEAEAGYKKVLNGFSESKEEALWGLGWMKYISGEYAAAAGYFEQLTGYAKSRDYYKYVYWRARAEGKLFEECVSKDEVICSQVNVDLPSDESFYGYLIKIRFSPNNAADKLVVSKPLRPDGETFERIEALALLGMRDEAVAEITASLKRAGKQSQFMYLGYMAMQLEKYREVIAFAEPKKRIEFLPYSYPHGYWGIVSQAARAEDLDAHLIAALIREESRFDPAAVSWAGARGLMQLMPSTARRFKKGAGVHFRNNSELQDVGINIPIGAHYLSLLIEEFGDVPLAIAAYNAGENRLNDWISKFDRSDLIEFIENIPYKETRGYVKKVLKSYWQYRTINGLPANAYPVLCKAECGHSFSE